MDWTAQVNNYCERTDFAFWSEPVNAISNGAFFIAAFLCLRLMQDRPDPGARLLVALLFAIGAGSFLFHTFATRWALLADVIPIQLFILTYLYLATTRFLNLAWWAGALAVVLFFPYAFAVSAAVTAAFGSLNGSNGYIPVPILIAAYGLVLRRRAPETARGLLIGAGILAVSLVFRTIDRPICDIFPLGTHFAWHILNGVMLGWMIMVLHRHDHPHPDARRPLQGVGAEATPARNR